ncbi:DMT family transporter [Actomonas aquatica]|uniref:EamA family transporter n=1 Tax=Actomonas aquatica TaxID=2866162 RepID=A0ABZ1C2T8_9BACT|nr:EamA family transporter [Opitutus sp. WL0086]WRQ86023.1 EamA family transporter [Opitutus sp. WL0086]
MNTVGLFLTSVLIWGSTWLVITFQLGTVPAEVSVAYRFGLAAALLFAWCAFRRLPLRYPARVHSTFALQGLLLFGLNYVLVYFAEEQISSGLVALIFSLLVFCNIAAARLFFGTRIRPATVAGALLGFAGVVLVLLPEIRTSHASGSVMLGAMLAGLSTISASLGNIMAAHHQRRNLPILQANAFSMLYGAVLVALYAAARGQAFTFDPSFAYISSLLYLAFFGSVVAFGAYLTLVRHIGADRAGYTAAAIPIVAIVLSTLFEGLQWHLATFAGVALSIAGTVLVLRTKSTPPPTPAPTKLSPIR